jgi:peptide/nickel transport system substrate-binding protein
LAAVAAGTAVTGPDYGGILRYAHRLDADTLYPHHNTTAYNYNEMHTFFEALVKVDSDGNFLPSLATSWEIAEDGKDIIFDLRKGVKFGDGTDFNAAAVKYNHDRIMDPDTISPQRGYIVPPLTAVKVLDDHKVRFQVDKPFRPLMGILIDRPGWIASPTAIEKYGEDFGRNPVSTGPYEFVEWSPGQRVVYKKNPNYWGEGLPYLDGILWLDVPDVTIQIAMVRTDEIDMTDREIRNADLATIRRNPNMRPLLNSLIFKFGFRRIVARSAFLISLSVISISSVRTIAI